MYRECIKTILDAVDKYLNSVPVAADNYVLVSASWYYLLEVYNA